MALDPLHRLIHHFRPPTLFGARYVARIDRELTVPSTDNLEYRDLNYAPHLKDAGEACVQMHLQRVLPVPRPNVGIQEIINFKNKRRDEIVAYRAMIDELHDCLAKCADSDALRQCLVRFEEEQKQGIGALSKALADARIETFFGSLKTLIKIKPNSVAFWGSVLGLAGLVVGPAPIAVPVLALGGLSGVVEVSAYLAARRAHEPSR